MKVYLLWVDYGSDDSSNEPQLSAVYSSLEKAEVAGRELPYPWSVDIEEVW